MSKKEERSTNNQRMKITKEFFNTDKSDKPKVRYKF